MYASFAHPNILVMFDYIEDGAEAFIILEWVVGTAFD
jgi:hypothetical protein